MNLVEVLVSTWVFEVAWACAGLIDPAFVPPLEGQGWKLQKALYVDLFAEYRGAFSYGLSSGFGH